MYTPIRQYFLSGIFVLLLLPSTATVTLAQVDPFSPGIQAENPTINQVDEPASRTRFLRWAYQDAGAFIQSSDLRVPFYVLGSVALLAPASFLDESIKTEIQEEYGGGAEKYLNVVNELGGPRATIPVASVFAISLLTDDERFQDAAFTSLQSLVYSGAIHYSIKYLVGRSRPYQGEGPWSFDPFSGNTSFVSGHTATAFAILTPWAMYYPGPVTYGLLALGAGGTGIARIARDRHWATDVVAGAAIGFVTARWLSKRHINDQLKPVTFDAYAAPGSLGFSLKVRM